MSRLPNDAYYTPDDLAEKLVGLLPLSPGDFVLEPSVGGGAFARALRKRGAEVVGCDINPRAEGVPDCSAFIEADFLTLPPPCTFEWVVGNPPYTDVEQHIEKALSVSPNVAFLLRVAVTESASRIPFWQRWPLAKVWVLAERPSFTGGKTDSCAYGWFWFSREHTGYGLIIPGWSWK